MSKTLFYVIIVTMFAASIAMASDCQTSSEAATLEEIMELRTDVPKFLEGATITVRLANGKESVVPAEKFKVVPRKQQFIVSKMKQVDRVVCVDTSKEAKKNRLSVLGGRGPKPGLHRLDNGYNVEVESKDGLVGGAQYQRLLTEKLSVGAQVQSNESLLLNIGLDF